MTRNPWLLGVAALFCVALACQKTDKTTNPPDGEVVCTMDAKVCADGSSVGRSGPDCEFEACPGEGEAEPQSDGDEVVPESDTPTEPDDAVSDAEGDAEE